ncbi:hypothetical protein LTR86_001151 [Recurvomyces mirabilis]|nr:hypothetical protein LTR86_001151 [Recurvomyces mirabilis]
MHFIKVFGIAAALITTTVTASPLGPPTTSVAAPATESAPASTSTTSDKPVMAIIAGLKKDPTGQGITHIGDDGIIRTYDGQGNVLDNAPLSTAQLNAHLSNLPTLLQPHEAHLRDTYRNVSGHDVTDMSQILTPPDHLRPLGGPGSVGWVPKTADEHEHEKRIQGPIPVISPLTPCFNRRCNGDGFCHSWRCGDCVAIDRIVVEETWGICASPTYT